MLESKEVLKNTNNNIIWGYVKVTQDPMKELLTAKAKQFEQWNKQYI